jgi:hypothetical protein
MSRISIEIPEALNARINESIAFSQLDHRDKGRLFLYAMEKMIAEPLPGDFLARCRVAKDAIREKQKKRYQELTQ